MPLTASRSTRVVAFTAVAFSPDGRAIASGSNDSATQLWNLDVSYAINWICSTTRLTRQQWHQYMPQLPYRPPCLQ